MVDNSTPENHAPTVALTGVFNGSATANATVDPSTNVAIAFDKADVDGDPVTVTLEYSATGSAPFTTITTGYAGASPYNWAAPSVMEPSLVEGTKDRFRITANDGELSTIATSAEDVGVTTVDYKVAGAFSTLILDQSCEDSTCHANKPSRFDSNSAASANDYATTILAFVNDNTMPPAGALSPSDKAKVQLWYWQGAR